VERFSKIIKIYKKNKVYFLIFFLLFIFLGFEFVSFIFIKDRNKISALVLSCDVLKGHPINFPVLNVKQVEKKNIDCSVVTDQDLHLLGDMYALNDLKKGEFLCWENIVEKKRNRFKVPKGLKAYSFRPVNFLEVFSNDRIDIALSTKDGTTTLIEGALVLDRMIYRGKLEIIIGITQKEIELLEKASRSGDLTVLLRNPEDKFNQVNSVKSDFFKKSRPRIEVWVENE